MPLTLRIPDIRIYPHSGKHRSWAMANNGQYVCIYVCIYIYTYRHTYRHIDIQTYRQTDIHLQTQPPRADILSHSSASALIVESEPWNSSTKNRQVRRPCHHRVCFLPLHLPLEQWPTCCTCLRVHGAMHAEKP